MAMSDTNEDRTVAFDIHGADKGLGAKAGLVDVPKARLTCTDPSQVDGALPGEGIIHLAPGGEQTVGRGDTCTYPINSRKLSRQHARVFPGVGAWGIEDLNSTNGVRVNEEKVQTAWLKHGDIVRFGPIPFQFEVERPDMAAVAAAAARRPAAADSGDGEHTMMFSGSGGAKAAEVMIKAVREAEKEPPPTIVPTTPCKAAPAGAAPAKKTGSNRMVMIGGAAVLVLALVAGGVIYYPIFQKNQRIAAVIETGSKTIERVITRARDLSGTAPTDGVGLEDIKVLQPVVTEAGAALGDNPESRELANLYARGQFLVFEREFAALFNRPDPTGDFLKQASRQAVKLRSTLDRIAHQLPPQPAGGDQDTLKTAADLADLASVLVGYRSFSRQFPQVGKAGSEQAATPTPEQIAAIDGRKKDFIQYSKTYHQILTRDYRLFNALVQDVENRDFALVNRWREAAGAAH